MVNQIDEQEDHATVTPALGCDDELAKKKAVNGIFERSECFQLMRVAKNKSGKQGERLDFVGESAMLDTSALQVDP